jgi:hypothetical protein
MGGAADAADLLCVFCQHQLIDGTEQCEALLCGHTFHAACIASYCLATGRPKFSACPFKCNVVGDAANVFASLGSEAGHGNGVGAGGSSSSQAAGQDPFAQSDAVAMAAVEAQLGDIL